MATAGNGDNNMRAREKGGRRMLSKALKFVRSYPWVSAVCVGMVIYGSSVIMAMVTRNSAIVCIGSLIAVSFLVVVAAFVQFAKKGR